MLTAQWLMAAIWLVLGFSSVFSDLSYASHDAGAVSTTALSPARKAASIALAVVAIVLMGYQIGNALWAKNAPRSTQHVKHA